MKYIVFDTETTGMYDFKAPADSPNQPYIVQLAAALVNEQARVLGSINFITVPYGITIPMDAAKVHGITDAIAEEFGVDEQFALEAFSKLASMADVAVAHNMNFDASIVRTAVLRKKVAPFLPKNRFCTMHASTDVCKLPSKGRSYKWPKLQEAFQILVDPNGFDGAHDAMVDVLACKEVFFALKELDLVKLQ